MPNRFLPSSLSLPFLTLAVVACGASNDIPNRSTTAGGDAPSASAGGSGSSGSVAGGSAIDVGGGPGIGLIDTDGGAKPGTADTSCATASATATLVKQPVDIILVIDNSGSMQDEIDAVEKNINNNFANILAASQIDYRVILISRHGSSADNNSICITAPLSGAASCTPFPPAPVNAARFFHYSIKIESTDSFERILGTYNLPDAKYKLTTVGWSEWLRPGARRAFLEITDDKSATDWKAFDTALMALTPKNFGTAAARNYVWHSIVGVKEKSPATAAWLPEEPVQNATCTGNGGDVVTPGVEYQELSRLTGGLRFPLCEWTSYDVVFKAIAQEVVTKTAVSCDFAIPPAPSGQKLDLDKVAVQYKAQPGAAPKLFKQAVSLEKCVTEAFYIASGQIFLCPEACSQVRADSSASVDVLFTCQSTVIVN